MTENPTPFPIITYRTKFTPLYALTPLVMLSALIGWIYQNLDFEVSFTENTEGNYGIQAIEGIFYVVIAVLGGFLVVFAMKKQKYIFIKIFFGTGIFASTLVLSWFHGYLIEEMFFPSIFWIEIIAIILGVVVSGIALYSLILEKGSQK